MPSRPRIFLLRGEFVLRQRKPVLTGQPWLHLLGLAFTYSTPGNTMDTDRNVAQQIVKHGDKGMLEFEKMRLAGLLPKKHT